MYAVIRRCCQGPCCDKTHPPWEYKLGIQYATTDQAKADEVAKNWARLDARVVDITENLFTLLEPSSAKWLREWCERNNVQVLQDLGAGI